jgi:transcriptional regulator with PAS, ATPase and Fis domain
MPAMVELLERLDRYASLDTTVLILGETGTGKELAARLLHARSVRAGRALVTVDCGALPESLAESELFGHERGAFTGADRAYAGRIAAAAGGTLFLDEVNSLPLAIQSKLLRFLERQELARLGQERTVRVDVRVIAASNVPLDELVAAGRMRADFFYRLDVLRIELPPLRERIDDLPLLVEQLLRDDAVARACGVTSASGNVLAELRTLSWPGNVRQLGNLLRRSVVTGAEGSVLQRLDHGAGGSGVDAVPPRTSSAALPSYHEWMRTCERRYLRDLVERHPGVAQRVTASGLSERTLHRKVKQLRGG